LFTPRVASPDYSGLATRLGAAVAEKAAAWHGLLWSLRLAEARAEVALARADWDEALDWSTRALGQSKLIGRVKYEALGLTTRGRTLAAVRRMADAIADFQRATEVARQIGDPAPCSRWAAAKLSR
jgi:hypothetical protein